MTITDIYQGDSVTEADILLTTGIIKYMAILYPSTQLVVVGKELTIGDLDRMNHVLEEVSEQKNPLLNNQDGS